jgi:hypothetical protein
MSIHLSLVTSEYHLVRLKRFLSLWYIWRKPRTYLVPTLTLYPNGAKRDSTWPTSPMYSIGCVQNDFWAMVCSAQTVHLSRVNVSTTSKMDLIMLPLEPRHRGVSLGASKTIPEPRYVHHNPCTYLAQTLTQSPKWTEMVRNDPSCLGVTKGASKMISKPRYVLRNPCTYFAHTLT